MFRASAIAPMLLVLAIPAGSAQAAGVVESLSAKLSGSSAFTFGIKGTKSGDASPQLSPITKMSLFIDKRVRIDIGSKKIKSCSKAVLRSEDGCPKTSRLSSTGSARTALFPLDTENPQLANVTAFKASSKKIYMLVKPKIAGLTSVITGTIKSTSGTYGTELKISFPSLPPNAGSLAVLIDTFSITAKPSVNGAKVITLARCSGSYKFKAKISFGDGEVQTPSAKQSC